MMRVRRKKRWMRYIILFLIIMGAGVGCFWYIQGLAYKVCRVEAGVAVTAADFMKNQDPAAFFTEDSESFDCSVPGEYQVIIRSGWFQHHCKLIIQDTVAPAATICDMQIEIGEALEAEAFISEIADVTPVEITYEQTPDFTKVGEQKVIINLTDQGENTTKLEAKLSIVPIRTRVVIEAGSKIPIIEDFVIQGKVSSFLTDMSAINYHKIQEIPVKLLVDQISYEAILEVVDTVAPAITPQDVDGYTLVPLEAEAFVASVSDETDVTVSFVTLPDLLKEGEQELRIKATDEAGNETEATARLKLEADTEPPVITGPEKVNYFVGDTIAYRKLVEVADNCNSRLELEVDSSQVNLNAEGSYPVTYTACDLAGNRSELTIELIVRVREHTEEEVNALADQVLSRIITEDMTPLEKVQAIYNYNMNHIGYINHSEKVDWITSAYEGLALGKGDCFVYASTAKVLLTRAGITNMDIAKIPAKTSHYWNLVDIGDGWYHFDTTPRTDHPTIFMWTDAQMMEYSNSHNKSHNYDRDAYPVVN